MKIEGILEYVFHSTNSFKKIDVWVLLLLVEDSTRVFDNYQVILQDYLITLFIRI